MGCKNSRAPSSEGHNARAWGRDHVFLVVLLWWSCAPQTLSVARVHFISLSFFGKYRVTSQNDRKTKTTPRVSPSYLSPHERKWVHRFIHEPLFSSRNLRLPAMRFFPRNTFSLMQWQMFILKCYFLSGFPLVRVLNCYFMLKDVTWFNYKTCISHSDRGWCRNRTKSQSKS